MKSIRELLTDRGTVSVTASETVLSAVKTMQEEHVGALLVTTPEGTLGMFTERDLMLRVVVAGRDPGSTTVGEVMTTDLFTAAPEQRINDVAHEMQARHIRHLPVVDEGRVVGMLSLRDLLREHLQIKRDEVRQLTSYIQGDGEGPHLGS